MLGSYFLYNWLILWQNTFYLYLGRSKLGLMYQEVCCSNISSGTFKEMKIDPRKKWRKADSLSLNKSSTDTAIEVKWRCSTQAWFIENYDFRISRLEIRPMLSYLIKVFFLKTLEIYKADFKSQHIRIERPRTHILCVKLLRLYTIGFCDEVLLDLHCWWSEKLCSQ